MLKQSGGKKWPLIGHRLLKLVDWWMIWLDGRYFNWMMTASGVGEILTACWPSNRHDSTWLSGRLNYIYVADFHSAWQPDSTVTAVIYLHLIYSSISIFFLPFFFLFYFFFMITTYEFLFGTVKTVPISRSRSTWWFLFASINSSVKLAVLRVNHRQ